MQLEGNATYARLAFTSVARMATRLPGTRATRLIVPSVRTLQWKQMRHNGITEIGLRDAERTRPYVNALCCGGRTLDGASVAGAIGRGYS